MKEASNPALCEPAVIRDPRFRAGRKLVQGGQAASGAIEMFATLVEETRIKYGSDSLNAAASYYEYGNALFRAACSQQVEVEESGAIEVDDERKPAAVDSTKANNEKGENNKENEKTESEKTEKPDNDDKGQDDVQLALELMENSWAIVDKFAEAVVNDEKKSNDKGGEIEYPKDFEKVFMSWAEGQLPRILLGIGDVLSFQNKKSDAVDAYTRAIPFREEYKKNEEKKRSPSIHLLKQHRQLAEVYVLVAETLLECPAGSDVITSESKSLLVKDEERIDFARGYYEKAKDALQETVFLMGELASTNLGTEKEDVCFLATMLMGVGTTLAEHDETTTSTVESKEPTKKKSKL